MDQINDIDRKDDGKDEIGVISYGVYGQEIEADSDLNEERNREQQLDDSFKDWYPNIEHWVHQKEDITQVPHSDFANHRGNWVTPVSGTYRGKKRLSPL